MKWRSVNPTDPRGIFVSDLEMRIRAAGMTLTARHSMRSQIDGY